MGQKSRINKYLARCGVASRRAAEKLIGAGRVAVNGVTLEELGRVIDHDLDKVTLDGKLLRPESRSVYLLLHKPAGVITTVTDPHGRPTVADLVRDCGARVYPVGRLDFDTDGVLLLTNDGELAHRLTHPRYQVAKVYRALVAGKFLPEHARRIREGIGLEDGHIGTADARLVRSVRDTSQVELTLTEGHKREVKQLLALCGLPVSKLTRVSFAGLSVRGLTPGEWRELTKAEVVSLRKQTER